MNKPTDLQLTNNTFSATLQRTENEDISSGAEWQINNHHHTIVLHQHGVMNELTTELDGHGKSFGPANVGEIWIIPANSSYSAIAKGNKINYSVLTIDPSNASLETLKALHGVWDLTYFQAINELLNYQDNSDTSLLMRASIEQFICQHLRQHYSENSDNSAAKDKLQNKPQFSKALTKNLQHFIYANLANNISLERLAEFTDMTTHQFLLAFRKAFLTSPAQYIIEQRLRLAQWQLSHSDNAITDIAYASGFASHSHLSSTFKRKFHCTPKQFRRLWR